MATTRPLPTTDLEEAYNSLLSYPLNMHQPLSPDILKKLEWKHAGSMEYAHYVESPDAEQQKAVFTVIGRIQDSSASFKLGPDGDWHGPGGASFNSELHSARMSCFLEKPNVADRPGGVLLDATWPNVTSNFDSVTKNKRTEGSVEPQTFLMKTGAVKVSHKLFKTPSDPNKKNKKSSDDADATVDNPNAVDCTVHPSLVLAGWPFTPGGRAANAVTTLPTGTTVVPLPAYTYDPETLILPEDYAAKFKGALVLCHIVLAHFYKKNEKKDTFLAEIVRIDFLAPRIVAPLMSPTKKRRLNPQ